jgi:acyl-CoA synthetase (AMP-forming)/AMP-acid ligase II
VATVTRGAADGGPAPTKSYGFGDALAANAAATPDAVALVCGTTEITWAELHRRCTALARVLRAEGVSPGDRVLWWGQNCHRLLECLFAAEQLGAIVCPINWRLSTAELSFVLTDCAPRLVVWQDQDLGAAVAAVRALHAVRADGAASDTVFIRHDGDGGDGYEARLRSVRAEPASAWSPSDDAAPLLMLYTAAFDGRPNGALLSARALLAQSMTLRLQEGLDASTVYLNSGPMFHIGSLRRTLAVAHAGGRNIMCRRVNATQLCELIDRHRCTHAFLQPPTMAQMVDVNADRRFDLSSLRANPGPPGWAEHVTVVPAESRITSGYGQTEVAGVVTYNYPATPSVGGRPGPLATVDVHDPDGNPVGAGQLGEIVVRGPMVMNGYHDRPELSARRSRGGWHHTNDVGRRESDGSISFVAPLQRIIKTAAENVYPTEVEDALKRHPAVSDAAVLGVPDPVWSQRVKAVVVTSAPLGEAELLDFCRTQLAGYKCPRIIAWADELPRAATGLDRDAVDAVHGGGNYPGTSTTTTKEH